MFATEEACRDYLALLRWPDGFRCPRCDSDKAFPLARGLYECAACHRQTSITAGTIFQDTRKPLQMWFRAMWHVTEKTGVSAASLQRALGLGSYQTAWTWLHKLRRAMVPPGRDRLSGEIEVGETLIGGKEEGVRGRQTHWKMLVVIAAQVRGTLAASACATFQMPLLQALCRSSRTPSSRGARSLRTDGGVMLPRTRSAMGIR